MSRTNHPTGLGQQKMKVYRAAQMSFPRHFHRQRVILKRRGILYQQSLINPVSDIVTIQGAFLNSKALEERRNLGQFFTGLVVS
ncbi:hypothetical protein VU13_06010, partial [Desulfobulbus sp. US5]|nr:hypothetical protein [Desulfobulbus sp. US5]